MTVAIVWAFPWALAGIILCLSVVGAPIGIALIAFGSYPAARIFANRTERLVAWEYRDQALDEDAIEPWMLEDEL